MRAWTGCRRTLHRAAERALHAGVWPQHSSYGEQPGALRRHTPLLPQAAAVGCGWARHCAPLAMLLLAHAAHVPCLRTGAGTVLLQ